MEHLDWLHLLNDTVVLGNSAFAWIIAAISALVGYIIVYGIISIVAARLRKLSERKPRLTVLQMTAATVSATRGWLILFLAIAIALKSLSFQASVVQTLSWVIVALAGIQAAFWISTLLTTWLKRATPDGSMQKTNPVIYGLLTWAVEMMVWVTLLMILMSQAGVHIGAFVASLGVGGIAIAMAARNVLEDLFASIAIGLDKPFQVGEFIAFGAELGTIRKVGIKSIRIESLSGEEMAVSNAALLSQLVHNYSRRTVRRIVFGFHVPLDTPRDKVEQVAKIVNDIIDGTDLTRRDRGHFLGIESEGYRYEFVYYMLTPDYTPYCDTQQSINLAILEQLETLGVRFAMPMRAVYKADLEQPVPANG